MYILTGYLYSTHKSKEFEKVPIYWSPVYEWYCPASQE